MDTLKIVNLLHVISRVKGEGECPTAVQQIGVRVHDLLLAVYVRNAVCGMTKVIKSYDSCYTGL